MTRKHRHKADPVMDVITRSFCVNKKVSTQGMGTKQHPNLTGVRKICPEGERQGQQWNESCVWTGMGTHARS